MTDNIETPVKTGCGVRALVLFSGGQDSTVSLCDALCRYDYVETIGFDYGQRHDIELKCRKELLRGLKTQFPQWGRKLGEDHLLKLTALHGLSETALTRSVEIEITEGGLPNSFVPGRNLLFFTYAAALAYRRDLTILVGGMCETDYSGYPDCRNDTLEALAKALQLGTGKAFQIDTPLMWQTKAETWDFAEKLGGAALIDLIIEESHSCYLGDRKNRHPWGYGCGDCPACLLRKDGYHRYKERKDHTL